MKFNYDKLNNVARKSLGSAAFTILTRLDRHAPETQTGAIALLFLLMCERFGLQPQEVFTAVKNALAHDRSDGRNHFGAVRDYLRHEFK